MLLGLRFSFSARVAVNKRGDILGSHLASNLDFAFGTLEVAMVNQEEGMI